MTIVLGSTLLEASINSILSVIFRENASQSLHGFYVGNMKIFFTSFLKWEKCLFFFKILEAVIFKLN